jgi:uncharacterized protein DUF6852/uncharacterized protein DUF5606
MEFKDIASVSGKGGLFKVIKPTRTGVILESLDSKKQRLMAGIQQRVSVLNEISVYTTSNEGSIPLEDVVQRIYSEFKEDTGLDESADNEELKAFFKHVIPDYDGEKVYVSDFKKILNWYQIILRESPALLKAQEKNKGGKEKGS